jgi:hypothetical protein
MPWYAPSSRRFPTESARRECSATSTTNGSAPTRGLRPPSPRQRLAARGTFVTPVSAFGDVGEPVGVVAGSPRQRAVLTLRTHTRAFARPRPWPFGHAEPSGAALASVVFEWLDAGRRSRPWPCESPREIGLPIPRARLRAANDALSEDAVADVATWMGRARQARSPRGARDYRSLAILVGGLEGEAIVRARVDQDAAVFLRAALCGRTAAATERGVAALSTGARCEMAAPVREWAARRERLRVVRPAHSRRVRRHAVRRSNARRRCQAAPGTRLRGAPPRRRKALSPGQGCFWNTMVPVTTPLELEDATDTCKKASSSMQ